MPITDATPTQLNRDLWDGVHQPADDYRIALIKPSSSGTFNASYATYTAGMGGDEVATGGGYTQGGKSLTGRASGLNGATGYLDFADATWASSTITAAGFVIYNATRSNKVLCVANLRDGSGNAVTGTSTNGDFTVTIPRAGTGMLRLG